MIPRKGELDAMAVASVREHYLRKLRLCFKEPESAIVAEAETLGMNNQQLQGYLALCELGSIHHETASLLMQRVPYFDIPKCVLVLTAAHERAVGL